MVKWLKTTSNCNHDIAGSFPNMPLIGFMHAKSKVVRSANTCTDLSVRAVERPLGVLWVKGESNQSCHSI